VDCERCAYFDLIGYGPYCPCRHVDGKCVTPVTREELKLLRDMEVNAESSPEDNARARE